MREASVRMQQERPTSAQTTDAAPPPGCDRVEPQRFDIRRLRRFWQLASPYWRSDERWRAGVLLAVLVALLLGQTGFNVAFVALSGELTSALAAQNGDRFWSAIRASVGVLAIAAPIWALYYYVRDTLAVHWRRWLTHRLLDSYLGGRAYYRLNERSDIDNPDQRIADDIGAFTQQTLYFLMVALGALIQLVAFTGLLWSISRELVYFLVAYAAFGTLVTALLFGRRLIGLNYRQLRREADFRFGLVRIREHAEAIAFLGGERDETRLAKRRFQAAFDNFRRLVRAQFGLNLFQYGFSFLTIVLPSAIIAHRVLAGELEVGAAVQAGGAFTAILAALTVVVEHFEGLSRLSAGADRLHGFVASVAEAADPAPGEGARIAYVRAPHIALQRVTVRTPGHERTLVTDLSVVVKPGRGLLIAGPSGGGKTSLLRAIAGLWTAGSGSIERPDPADLHFLPQQPYMALGTLRTQLLYAQGDARVEDEALQRALARVNLGELIGRFGGLDAERDWTKVLSIGEQQRLAFARVLVAAPRYALLDEATSALDRANEDNLYAELAAIGTTPISVSHRPGILRFHADVLELPGDGSWRVLPAAGYRFDDAPEVTRSASA